MSAALSGEFQSKSLTLLTVNTDCVAVSSLQPASRCRRHLLSSRPRLSSWRTSPRPRWCACWAATRHRGRRWAGRWTAGWWRAASWPEKRWRRTAGSRPAAARWPWARHCGSRASCTRARRRMTAGRRRPSSGEPSAACDLKPGPERRMPAYCHASFLKRFILMFCSLDVLML